MSKGYEEAIRDVVEKYSKDSGRLIDIAIDVQRKFGYISEEMMKIIGDELNIPLVKVRDTISFYSFFKREPGGKNVIRICNSVIEKLNGMDAIVKEFEKETGANINGVSHDKEFELKFTPCIGMSDQPPSALINGVPVVNITPSEVKNIVENAKKGKYSREKASDAISWIDKNIRQPGPVVFAPMEKGKAIRAALNMTPEDVIDEVTKARLRGRGGAGFPTGMKWNFCRKAKGEAHYIICNADEGEPGTFKDRTILTEVPDLVFEGMTVAGYAIGASEGFLYLRGEYVYLKDCLEQVLERRRELGLLGKNICGKEGFNFDIRIQVGAGAYVCGEESGLIESLEGNRGAPRHRPPYPVTSGYKNQPTAVNNVETLCCAARILEKGAEWFSGLGTKDSTGTKLLSVSGDCDRPGVYELEYGITIDKLLEVVGANDAQAVQVGGPSGTCVAPKDFGRRICFEELPTGGSVMIFNSKRNLLWVVREFMEFFVEESCGWCVPCRVGTTLLVKKLDKIIDGKGSQLDLKEIEELANTVKNMSRCGLGQAAPNPILTTIKNFRTLYDNLCKHDGYIPPFDYEKAIAVGIEIAGREPVVEEE